MVLQPRHEANMDESDIIILSDGSTSVELLTITLLAGGYKVVTIPSVQQLKAWSMARPCTLQTFVIVIGQIMLVKLASAYDQVAGLMQAGGVVCVNGTSPEKAETIKLSPEIKDRIAFCSDTSEVISFVKDHHTIANK